MADLFLKIVNMSISASWLVLAVVILRLVLKKAPKRFRPVLWGIVGIRLLLPFSIESVFSLIPSAETISPDIMYAQAPTIHSGISVLNSAVNPVISESFAPDPLTSANPLQIWIPVAAVIWAIGVAAMLIYLIVSSLRLRRQVQTAVLLQDHIYQSEHVASPFVLGLFRPGIYLPFHLSDKDMPHVIAHEQAHIKRRDHWIKPLGYLLLCVYWFNPVLWLAYLLLCRDIELACDERVIQDLGADQRADYSEALLSCSVPRRMIVACPIAFGEVGVKARVKNVLNYKKPAFWVIVVAVLSCIVVAVCFLTNPKSSNTATLSDIYAHSYDVAEVAYNAPMYSFTYVVGQNTPYYAITEELHLLSKNEITTGKEWADLGPLNEFLLTKDNFDQYFSRNGAGGWLSQESAKSIRKANAKAWKLVYPFEVDGNSFTVLYYVLQQQNGNIYLAYGYDNEDDSSIRWLFRLTMDDHIGNVYQWLNYYDSPQEMPWDGSLETEVPEYPGVTFRWTPGQVVSNNGIGNTILFVGMPIWNVYFTDLTGDGLPELCATVSEGSGIIDTHVVVVDYSSGETYTLWDRGVYDYALTLKNGRLLVTKSEYPRGTTLAIGELILTQDEAGAYDTLHMGFDLSPGALIRSYTFQESCVALYDTGAFSFTFSLISSYLGYGAYEIENDRLTLHTSDGQFTYVFDMVDDTLVFDAGASSKETWFSDLYDGAVLK